jgi:transcriptional regulator with XRE-family HTH domain
MKRSDPADHRHWRAQELAIFLRSRREKLAPEAVGLSSGERRRTKGLRREEVASLLGVSSSWYTKLEQGIAASPSPRLLGRIADVLRLSRAEQAQLLRLGLGEVEAVNPISADEILPPVQSIIDAMHNLPAMVVRASHADYVASNAAANALFGDFRKFAGNGNQLVSLFTQERARNSLPDWKESARRQLAMFRAAFARNVHDPDMRRFVADLSAKSPEFRALWQCYDLPSRGARTLDYRHADGQTYQFQLVTFFADSDCQYRVEVFHPDDERTRRWMEALVTKEGEASTA